MILYIFRELFKEACGVDTHLLKGNDMSSRWPVKRIYTSSEIERQRVEERLQEETKQKLLRFYLSPRSRMVTFRARLDDARHGLKSGRITALPRLYKLTDGSMNTILWQSLFKAVYGTLPTDDADARWDELFAIRQAFTARVWAMKEAKRLKHERSSGLRRCFVRFVSMLRTT
jgi:hypothetical protein